MALVNTIPTYASAPTLTKIVAGSSCIHCSVLNIPLTETEGGQEQPGWEGVNRAGIFECFCHAKIGQITFMSKQEAGDVTVQMEQQKNLWRISRCSGFVWSS